MSLKTYIQHSVFILTIRMKCKLLITNALICTRIPSEMLLFELTTKTNKMVCVLCSPEDTKDDFQT